MRGAHHRGVHHQGAHSEMMYQYTNFLNTDTSISTHHYTNDHMIQYIIQ